MSRQPAALIEFPCDFPIKAFGLSREGFEGLIVAIVRRHAPDLVESDVVSRASEGGKYTAVTVSVHAHAQAQLDAIYRDLTDCPEIITVL